MSENAATATRSYEELLGRLRPIPNVESADLWQTGGGIEVLAVRLTDGRFISASVGDFDELLGRFYAEGGVPGPNERWGFYVSEDEQAWEDWNEDRMECPQATFADDGLVAAITAYAENRRWRVTFKDEGEDRGVPFGPVHVLDVPVYDAWMAENATGGLGFPFGSVPAGDDDRGWLARPAAVALAAEVGVPLEES